MKTIRRLISLIPLLILWLMVSIILWGFVFNLITDAPPSQKITLCVDAETPGATSLAVLMEEKLEGSVRMVKVRPFDYAMFDSGTLTGADLLIVPASHVETYQSWFAPIPSELLTEDGLLEIEGIPYGIPAYEADTDRGAAAGYIQYNVPGREAEDYYLFFGKESVHLSENEKAADNAAVDAARCLFDLYK